MNNLKAFILALVFSFSLINQSFTQEFSRKGFYFSVGGGPGFTYYKIDGGIDNPNNVSIIYDGKPLVYYDVIKATNAEMYPFTKGNVSFNTNFNIGYGFNENIVVSYMNRVAFIFNDPIHRVDYAQPKTTTSAFVGLTGIEGSYFFSSEMKSLYASLGIGISVLRQPFVVGYLSQMGMGFSGSAGYQFSKHFAAEVNLMYLSGEITKNAKNEIEKLDNKIEINEEFNSLSLSFGIKYLFF